MDSFSKFIDQIKADDVLKDRAKIYAGAGLANEAFCKEDLGSKNHEYKRTHFARRRIMAVVFTLIALSIITTGGYALYNYPANYVSLDINPSVELATNVFDVVIKAEAVNEDAKTIVTNGKLKRAPIKEYLEAFISESAERGYFSDDGSTVVVVAAISKSEAKALQLQEESEHAIQNALKTSHKDAIIYADCMDFGVRAKARELGVTSGKYKLLEILRELDAELSIMQYRSADIRDIILLANELMASNGQAPQYELSEKTAEHIKQTALRLQSANPILHQQIQNSTQNGDTNDTINEFHQVQEQEQAGNRISQSVVSSQNSGTQTTTEKIDGTLTTTESISTSGSGVISKDLESTKSQEPGTGKENQTGYGNN